MDGLATVLVLALVGLVAFGLCFGVLLHFSRNATRARLRLIERTFEVERERVLREANDDEKDAPSA